MHQGHFKLKPLTMALFAVFVTACSAPGEDSNSTPDPGTTKTQTTNIQMSGAVVDGYLVKAIACLDINNNGYCDLTADAASNTIVEPAATTDDNGQYTLSLNAEQQADPRTTNARVLVFDGYDSDSGKRYEGKLFAAQDINRAATTTSETDTEELVNKALTVNVTAFTTLVSKLQDEGGTLEEAENKVRQVLNIPAGIDINADPVKLLKTTQSDETKKFVAQNVALHRSIETLVNNAAASTAVKDKAAETVFKAIVQSIKAKSNTSGTVQNVSELVNTAEAKTVLNSATDIISSSKVEKAAAAAEVTANQTETLFKAVTGTTSTAIERALQETELKVTNVVEAVDNAVQTASSTATVEEIVTAANNDATTAAAVQIHLITDFLIGSGVALTENQKTITNGLSTDNKLTLETVINLLNPSDRDQQEIIAAIQNRITAIDAEALRREANKSVIAALTSAGIPLTLSEQETILALDATTLNKNYSLTAIVTLSGFPQSVIDKINQQQASKDVIAYLATQAISVSDSDAAAIYAADFRSLVNSGLSLEALAGATQTPVAVAGAIKRKLANAEAIAALQAAGISATEADFANADASSLDHDYSLTNLRGLTGLSVSLQQAISAEIARLSANAALLAALLNAGISASATDLASVNATLLSGNYSLENIVNLAGLPLAIQQAVQAKIDSGVTPVDPNDPTKATPVNYIAAIDLADAKSIVANTSGWFTSLQDLQKPAEAYANSLGEVMSDPHQAEMQALDFALKVMLKTIELTDSMADGTYDIWSQVLQPNYDTDRDIQEMSPNVSGEIEGSIVKSGQILTLSGVTMPFLVKLPASGETVTKTVTLSVSVSMPLTTESSIHNVSFSDLSLQVGDTSVQSTSGLAEAVFNQGLVVRDEEANKDLTIYPTNYSISFPSSSISIANNPMGSATLQGSLSSNGYFKRATGFVGYDLEGGEEPSPETLSLNGSLTYGGQVLAVDLSGEMINASTFDPFANVDLSVLPASDNLITVTNGDDGSANQQITLAFTEAAKSIPNVSFGYINNQDGILLQLTNSGVGEYSVLNRWDTQPYTVHYATQFNELFDEGANLFAPWGGTWTSIPPYNMGDNGYYNEATGNWAYHIGYLMVYGVNMRDNPSGSINACSQYPISQWNSDTMTYEYICDPAEGAVLTENAASFVSDSENGTVTITWNADNQYQFTAQTFSNMYDAYRAQNPYGQWVDIYADHFRVGLHYDYPALPASGSSSSLVPKDAWLDVYQSEETATNYRQFVLSGSITADLKDSAGNVLPQVKISLAADRSETYEGQGKLTINYAGKEVSLYAGMVFGENAAPVFTFVDGSGKGWELALNIDPQTPSGLIGDLKSGEVTYGQIYSSDVEAGEAPKLYVVYTDGSRGDLFLLNQYLTFEGRDSLGEVDFSQSTRSGLVAKDLLNAYTIEPTIRYNDMENEYIVEGNQFSATGATLMTYTRTMSSEVWGTAAQEAVSVSVSGDDLLVSFDNGRQGVLSVDQAFNVDIPNGVDLDDLTVIDLTFEVTQAPTTSDDVHYQTVYDYANSVNLASLQALVDHSLINGYPFAYAEMDGREQELFLLGGDGATSGDVEADGKLFGTWEKVIVEGQETVIISVTNSASPTPQKMLEVVYDEAQSQFKFSRFEVLGDKHHMQWLNSTNAAKLQNFVLDALWNEVRY